MDGVNGLADTCVFCEIIEGRRKAEILHEDPEVLAFKDILPQAPTHILIVPKAHFPSVATVDPEVWGKVMSVAVKLAEKLGIEGEGFRLVINDGPKAGQTIPHLHVHLLAGRPFRWPPG
jgi:histidine triad (HIT) family protein